MTPPADREAAELEAAELEAGLLGCLASRTWARAVLAARPRDPAGWRAAAEAAYAALPDREVLEALAAHPPIGAAPVGSGPDAEASRREQAAVTGAGEGVRAALAAANRAYQERFGRVFLIRAAGRTPEQILSELARRLGNDDGTELTEAREQLRQITLLRLDDLLRERS